MKKLSRLVALLLALMLVVPSALAEDTLVTIDSTTYQTATTAVEADSTVSTNYLYERLLARLESMTTEERQAALNDINGTFGIIGTFVVSDLQSYYAEKYPDSNLICTCSTLGAYESEDHDETCPWHIHNVPAATVVLADEATGVSVSVVGNRLPSDLALSVGVVEADALDLEAFQLENTETVVTAYDIKLLRADGTEWQPSEGATATITMDAAALGMSDGLEYQIRHQHDETVTVSEVYTVADGKVNYVTEDFSIFTVTGLWGVATSTDINELTMYVGDTIYLREDNNNSNNWQITSGDSEVITYATYTKPDGSESTQSYCMVTANQAGTVTLRCGNNNSITITVIERPTESYTIKIEDTIYTDGCLIPVMSDTTLTGITYKWYRNSNLDGTGDYSEVTGEAISETYAATNGVNVAVDQGGKCWYKVEAYDANGTLIGTSDPYWIPYSNELENGSFETPNITNYNPFDNWGAGNVQFNQEDSRYVTTAANVRAGTALWWRTTGLGSTNNADGRDIEIVRPGNAALNGVYYVNPDDGNQYAELNCEAIGTLYQDVLTAPNTTLKWQFSHLGRTGTDTMAVVVMPANVADTWAEALVGQTTADGINNVLRQIDALDGAQVWYNLTASEEGEDNTPEWTAHSDQYETVEGQYLSRFFFVSVASAAGNLTMGNLIDGVSFDDKLNYTIRYYVDGELKETESGSVKPYTTVSASKTSNYSDYALEMVVKAANGVENKEWGSTSMKVETNDVYLDLHYVSTGVSITKKVVLANTDGMTDEEIAAAMKTILNSYSAQFSLKKGNEEVATATVSVNEETGEGVALFYNGSNKFSPAKNTTYTITETSVTEVDGYTLTKQGDVTLTTGNSYATASATYTNTYAPANGKLTITKIVKDSTFIETSEEREFTFTLTPQEGQTLTAAQSSVSITIEGTAEATERGSITIDDIPLGKYTVAETAPTAGYTTTYSVGETATQTVDVKDDTAAITVTNVAEGTYDEISVTKVWNDNSNALEYRPETITITLNATLPNGNTYDHGKDPLTLEAKTTSIVDGVETTIDNGDRWTKMWEDVPMYDAEGNFITYSVTESAVDKYNAPDITGDAATGFTVTNSIKVGRLVVKKTGLKETDTAIFTVTIGTTPYTINLNNNGTKTFIVEDGTGYGVTEDANWAKRYTTTLPENASGKITAGTETTVTIKNELVDKWLTDETRAVNLFNQTTTTTTGGDQ